VTSKKKKVSPALFQPRTPPSSSLLLTVTSFLGSSIDDLPTTVTRRKVRPGHPHFVPYVEIPAIIKAITIWTAFYLFATPIKIFVHCERGVCVVRRYVIGNRTAGDSQRPAYCQKVHIILNETMNTSDGTFPLFAITNRIYIQGVPGGMCETSGECSLC